MNRRVIVWGGVGVVALGSVGGWAWILSLPPGPRVTDALPISTATTHWYYLEELRQKHPAIRRNWRKWAGV